MDEAAAALTGAFIGASAGIAGGLLLEAYKRRRDRRGTASALAGEIASILFMAERRRYVEFFTGILPQLNAGVDVPIAKFGPGGDYRDPVVDRFLDKIGLLSGDLPERIVRFYSILTGIRRDLERMANGELNAAGKASVIAEDLAIWQEAVALGNQLMADLRRVVRRW
jgi:hypothetical protein